jgi:ABC-type lipoprotein release transport system permease subunit
MEQQLHERRAEALHPFSADPWRRRGPASGIIAIVVAVAVAIGVIALIIAT